MFTLGSLYHNWSVESGYSGANQQNECNVTKLRIRHAGGDPINRRSEGFEVGKSRLQVESLVNNHERFIEPNIAANIARKITMHRGEKPFFQRS